MSAYQNCKVVSLPCGENLTGDQYEVLKLNASGQVIKTAAQTDHPIGILASDPGTTEAGQIVPVALLSGGGVGLVKAGSSIAAGQLVVLDATGGRVTDAAGVSNVTDDRFILGHALESAADGETFKCLLGAVAIA